MIEPFYDLMLQKTVQKLTSVRKQENENCECAVFLVASNILGTLSAF
jgi:hypothetical protein